MQTEEGWAGVVRNTTLPRPADHLLSQKRLDAERGVPQTQDSSESYGYKKLTKVIIFLTHNLMGLKQEEIDRFQETLIQQLNDTQDKRDMLRRELRDSYRLRKETQWERHPTPASSFSRANSLICNKLRRGEPTLSA